MSTWRRLVADVGGAVVMVSSVCWRCGRRVSSSNAAIADGSAVMSLSTKRARGETSRFDCARRKGREGNYLNYYVCETYSKENGNPEWKATAFLREAKPLILDHPILSYPIPSHRTLSHPHLIAYPKVPRACCRCRFRHHWFNQQAQVCKATAIAPARLAGWTTYLPPASACRSMGLFIALSRL